MALDNRERAAEARERLKGGRYSIEDEAQSAVIDILADLRHLCDVENWNFDDLDQVASEHYYYEAPGAERREREERR